MCLKVNLDGLLSGNSKYLKVQHACRSPSGFKPASWSLCLIYMRLTLAVKSCWKCLGTFWNILWSSPFWFLKVKLEIQHSLLSVSYHNVSPLVHRPHIRPHVFQHTGFRYFTVHQPFLSTLWLWSSFLFGSSLSLCFTFSFLQLSVCLMIESVDRFTLKRN